MEFESLTQYLGFAMTAFTGFFAIMNPLANLPVFISMTEGASEDARRRVRKKALKVSFIIILSFILLGQIIFSMFGLTIPAFKLGGGILIFLAGIDMVRAKESRKAQIAKGAIENDFNESIAVSPLATPLMAGPGSIVTGMTLVSGRDWLYMIIVILMFGVVILLHDIAFKMSKVIVRRLGTSVISVIGKIMGLIITIIGTGMAIEGVQLAMETVK